MRLKYDLPLAKPDRATFYTRSDCAAAGYTDFPVSDTRILEGRM
jgi:NADPH2 dehydrogenase